MTDFPTQKPGQHIPVLAKTLAEKVKLPQDAVMVDATMGHGGHSLLFGRQLGPDGVIIGLDLDTNSIQRAQTVLSDLPCRVIFENENFADIDHALKKNNIEKVDFILADLGFCSAQLEDENIGMSFQQDMPLDMRLDRTLETTAADIVNQTGESELADLIFKYGEERASRRIARFIVDRRVKEPIETTGKLASIISKALSRPGKKWTKIHPATRTFQALRIAVNHELENLEKLLEKAPELLNQNGQIAIISFHSLEDRIVKWNFKGNKSSAIYDIVTKKPLMADEEEIAMNPRSRSAKLRIAIKK